MANQTEQQLRAQLKQSTPRMHPYRADIVWMPHPGPTPGTAPN